MMNNFRYENKTKVYFGEGSVGESLGGGSVSDCCKVVSAQAKLDEDLWELENTKHIFPSDLIPLGTITAQVWQSSIRRCTGTSALRMRAVSPAFPCVFCTPEKFEKSC